ncbi:MAG: peroxiredoxin family protein [Candidatus Neomarinimicrobiota bacterium]
MVRKWTVGFVVAVIGLLVLSGSIGRSTPQVQQQPTETILAPDFTLRNLNGEKVTLSQLRGKIVLLNFWATWCGPCRWEIPDLSRIYSAYKDKGVVVLGVSWDNLSNAQIKTFVTNYKVTYPILHGTQSELSEVGKAYRWQGYLPTTYVIDRQGHIQEVHVGARNEKFFLKSIEPLL